MQIQTKAWTELKTRWILNEDNILPGSEFTSLTLFSDFAVASPGQEFKN